MNYFDRILKNKKISEFIKKVNEPDFLAIVINGLLFSLAICVLVLEYKNIMVEFILNNNIEITYRFLFIAIFATVLLVFACLYLFIKSSNSKGIYFYSFFLSLLIFFPLYSLVHEDSLFANLYWILILAFILYSRHLINAPLSENFNSPNSNQKLYQILSWVLSGLYFIYFFSYSTGLYLNYESCSHDTAILNNVMHNISQFREPYTSIYQINFFTHHLSPVYYLILPFYLIFPSPITLFFFQTLFIALGGVMLYKLGFHLLKNNILAICIMVSYFLHPAIQGCNLFDFHENGLLAFPIIGLFYFLEKDKKWLFYIFLILAISVKEDVPFTGIMIGIYAIISKKQLKQGLITIGLCLVYYLISKIILVPGIFYSRYFELGFSEKQPELSFIISIISNPFFTLKLILMHIDKMRFSIILLAPMLYLCFYAWRYFYLIAPLAAYCFLTNYHYHFEYETHNSFPVVVMVYILAILGIREVQKKINVTLIFFAILISSFSANLYFGFISPAANISSKFEDTPIKQDLAAIISKIPANASVSAGLNLVNNLSNRDSIFTFPNPADKYSNDSKVLATNSNYVIINTNFLETKRAKKWNLYWPTTSSQEFIHISQQLINDSTYGVFSEKNGIFLLKKGFRDSATNLNDELFKYYSNRVSHDFCTFVDDKESKRKISLQITPEKLHENNPTTIIYGPFITLDPGRYNVEFALKINPTNQKGLIAKIEVFHNKNFTVFAEKHIHIEDFITVGKFNKFNLDFNLNEKIENLEFRVLYYGKEKLNFDYVMHRRYE